MGAVQAAYILIVLSQFLFMLVPVTHMFFSLFYRRTVSISFEKFSQAMFPIIAFACLFAASKQDGSNGSFGPFYFINLGLRIFELICYMFTSVFTFSDAVHSSETYALAKA
mmetsp:Transcript_13458/g.22739  ORF Transcript_13458/g.22739 Transcript_13458/m.22739 type:complete len:111 (+) Transcript_13458:304-636(+)|eukprot:CAMPEP_0198202628 /NCGR_PEP_ID=MMETSP1445-20131203/5817_1 /TAXON_ID=36898 /ORGANISM="Pyramimonas sp., Strain CCMP2087" /LENGTH=110 /DNA_ID=CAMNT_0043873647 /DNA_START=289 /DNA_END=621 /DNA_ORIENTATION=+